MAPKVEVEVYHLIWQECSHAARGRVGGLRGVACYRNGVGLDMVRVAKKTFQTCDGGITFINFHVPADEYPGALHEALLACDREVGRENIARQTFFLARQADQQEIERVVARTYGQAGPVTTCVFQPPAGGHVLSAELWAFSPGAVTSRQRHVTLATLGGVVWGFVGGMEAGEGETSHDGVHGVLSRVQQELERVGLEFGQFVRTWFYIGNILSSEKDETRYDGANRARNEFYRDKWPDLHLSPASTGIGMATDRFAFEGFVLNAAREAMEITSIDNPLQTPPHLYAMLLNSDRHPSFSRAAAVRFCDSVLLFVSGTASIRGSEVLCKGDPEAQVEITMENIATLIGADNLVEKYGFPRGATFDDLQQFRVYVKRPSDVDIVCDCCRRHFPEVPATYVIADVCRPDFLMEIEAVAAFKLDEGKAGG